MNESFNILNGSHRLGCMLYFKKLVALKADIFSNAFICKAEYFTDRELYKNNLPYPNGKNTINNIDTKYQDFSILEFIKLKKLNTRIICFLSENFNKVIEQLNNLISSKVNILYTKKINLTQIGMKNIIRESYLMETFVDIDWKTNACFGNLKSVDINVMVIESDSIDILNKFSLSGSEYKKDLKIFWEIIIVCM